jgi:hypothetical protein
VTRAYVRIAASTSFDIGEMDIALPPLPVLRERVGVRVIRTSSTVRTRTSTVQQFEITLILTFSRSTGRRHQYQYSNASRAITIGRFWPMLRSNPTAMKLASKLLPP